MNWNRGSDSTGSNEKIVLEVLNIAQNADTQGSGDAAPTRSTNGSGNQQQKVLEYWLGEQRRERYNQARQFEGQREYRVTSLCGVAG